MSISAPAGTDLFEIRDHAVDAVRSKYIQKLSSGLGSNRVLRIKDCLDIIGVCDWMMKIDRLPCSAVGGKCQEKSNACNSRRFKGLCDHLDDICCAEDDSQRHCVAYGGECFIFESSCVSGSKLQAHCSLGTCCMPYFVGPLKITAEKIAQAAESFEGSTKWKQKRIGFIKHWKNANKPKCNLFVFDVLLGISAAVPNRKKGSYAPIGANEWGNPDSIYIKEVRCYKQVTTTHQRGDIISFPYSQGLGHVGIITSTTHYISAQEYKIEVMPIKMNLNRVVWRYNYNDPDC
ncbi:hypothetical protein FSP39_005466 [Pinctada imbricata]|uniref:Peptidase C51 domain-containing protein n=1 Tax=Pinctada imbricata TaxID=66713 RepID=A0AA89C9Y7_PINIB|nr:hypothetical protein FSP39_005466 [Pinctada imbricata]